MPTHTNHAKYAFLYLLAFFTLFFVVLGAGQVLFQVINMLLPMGDGYWGNGDLGVLRFGLSSLLVAAPIFYFTTRAINFGIAAGDYSLDAGVRRWLTYAILLVAAGVGIGDLIFAFTSYLGGELTLRAGLKVLVILGLAGGVLAYYSHDIRRTDTKRTPLIRWFSAGFVTKVIAVFVLGLVFAGTPGSARLASADEDRRGELQRLQSEVSEFYGAEERLPETLDELLAENRVFAEDITDDQTGVPYGYRPTGEISFQLCATFATEATSREDGVWQPEWRHEAGEVCFDREVDEWVLDRFN